MTQKLVEKQEQTVAEEAKEARDRSFTVSDISTDAVTVNMTETVMRAQAELIQDGDEEKKVMDFSEEENTATHTLPLEERIYEKFKASPWDQLQQAMAEDDTQQQFDTQQFSAWDILSMIRTLPPVDGGSFTIAGSFPSVPEPVTEQHETVMPTVETAEDRPFSGGPRLGLRHATEDITYERVEQESYETNEPFTEPVEPDQVDVSTMSVNLPDIEAIDEETGGAVMYNVEEEGENPLLRIVRGDGQLSEERRENVAVATYDSEEREDQTDGRAAMYIDETLAENGSVKDAMLDLVDRGELDATIVRQPFYSTEEFEDADGETYEAGWQDGFHGAVQLEGMQIDMTEFSYGDDPDDLDLAMNDIASTDVDEDMYIDFRASEKYTCGAVEEDAEHREAWKERYDLSDDQMSRFESETERGVFGAMMEAVQDDRYGFEGASLDLSMYDDARDVFLEQTGVAPEHVLDNAVYDVEDDGFTTDSATAPGQAYA